MRTSHYVMKKSLCQSQYVMHVLAGVTIFCGSRSTGFQPVKFHSLEGCATGDGRPLPQNIVTPVLAVESKGGAVALIRSVSTSR
jgi:hypothetical protein